MRMKKLCLVLLLIHPGSLLQSAEKVLHFPEPQMEKNYTWLTNNLRCQKCANQTLSDSESDLANDLRIKVYKLVLTGKTRDEIVNYLVQRFGDRVAYHPPLRASTILLWGSPFVLLLFALYLMRQAVHNRRSQALETTQSLTQDEELKIQQLLDRDNRQNNFQDNRNQQS